MVIVADHTDQILAPFFGSNITSFICTTHPMTVFSMVQAACLGKYPLTFYRPISSSRNKNTGMIRVVCDRTNVLIYVITRRA